ncbi:PAS domain S-box protein [Oceanidesulfovibrio indonesiensis]|uniref:PAS domain S-box protein n=1 Tax=Oceanidesulfovibrio indonesiensis TaxID=54767 RepID=UPI001ABF85BC|nr:PAS domain S-box protein [Oceanidesulfovibrio indonesiensis]
MAASKDGGVEATAPEKEDAKSAHAANAGANQATASSDSTSGASAFHVVGLGASAGGFEALELFFRNVPEDSGAAYVVVQHLAPDHRSLMVELLSKHTAVPVVQAEDGMPVEPNMVYLIPPRKLMTIFNGRLSLFEKDPDRFPNYPIDIFFNSLAESVGQNAVAIVLSGTGSDGTRGVRAVKEHGGIVMVQDVHSAKFDGMPSNALATGLADYVLTPDAMPRELVKYASHPRAMTRTGAAPALKEEDGRLDKIYQMLLARHGVDFSLYKQNTLMRRIERRLAVTQITKLEGYIDYLSRNPAEQEQLFKEFLICVTRFFRDQEAYEIIRERVVPEIFRQKGPEEKIRVWVAGCATGEEAYSLAMLFMEYKNTHDRRNEVKIFATDVDSDSLEFASAAMYPESIAADLTREQLQRYFIRKGDRCQVVNPLREMVIFAKHNVFRDPPFNKIDLVACRNLLIYLQLPLQKRVFQHFNFGLNQNGFLFLGSSETIGTFTNLFSTYDARWKIYRSRGKQVPLPSESFAVSTVRHKPSKPETVFETFVTDVQDDQRKTLASIYEKLFEEYVPACCVVNEQLELVHLSGDVSDYLSLKPGDINLKITTLARKELAVSLETGLNKALRERTRVRYDKIRTGDDDARSWITLIIKPFMDEKSRQQMLLVVFERHEKQESGGVRASQDDEACSSSRFQDLEHELNFTKENLQAVIEELETTNEELQATNEELLSSNEELQSSNEELQSVNEELVTVNSEYQSKIHELTVLNNDMDNLLASTDIGTVFLDDNLTIRKFTPAASGTMNLLESDIGRPLAHLAHNFEYDTLLQDCRRVLSTRRPQEREVQQKNGDWYLLRIRPYRDETEAVSGVVLSFVDITALKKNSMELAKLSKAVELSPSIIAITDSKGVIEYVNQRFQEVSGYSRDEVMGKTHRLLKSGEMDDESYAAMWRSLEAGESWEGIFLNKRKDGRNYYEHANIVPVEDDDGTAIHYLKVAEDITERKKAQDMLEYSRRRMLDILENTTDSFFEVDGLWRFTFVNEKALATFGKSRRELLGRSVWAAFPELLGTIVQKRLEHALEAIGGVTFEAYIPEWCKWLEFHAFSHSRKGLLDQFGEELYPERLSVYFRDITRFKDSRQTLERSEERFRTTVQHAPVGMVQVDAGGHFLLINEQFCELTGFTSEELERLTFQDLTVPDDLGESVTLFRNLLAGKQDSYSLRKRYQRKDGDVVWVQISASAVRDSQGEFLYAIGVVDKIDCEPMESGSRQT